MLWGINSLLSLSMFASYSDERSKVGDGCKKNVKYKWKCESEGQQGEGWMCVRLKTASLSLLPIVH